MLLNILVTPIFQADKHPFTLKVIDNRNASSFMYISSPVFTLAIWSPSWRRNKIWKMRTRSCWDLLAGSRDGQKDNFTQVVDDWWRWMHFRRNGRLVSGKGLLYLYGPAVSSLSEVGLGVPLSFPSRLSRFYGNNTRAADGVTVVTVVAISITACPDTNEIHMRQENTQGQPHSTLPLAPRAAH